MGLSYFTVKGLMILSISPGWFTCLGASWQSIILTKWKNGRIIGINLLRFYLDKEDVEPSSSSVEHASQEAIKKEKGFESELSSRYCREHPKVLGLAFKVGSKGKTMSM